MHPDQMIPKPMNEDELGKIKKRDHSDLSVPY